MVKCLHGRYYVYKYQMVGGRKNKKTKMGKLIGRIDPQLGMIYNDASLVDDEFTIFDFGQFYFAFIASQSVYAELVKFFNPIDASKIYISALIYAANSYTPINCLPVVFRQSFLSLYFSTVPFGEKTISSLLDDLGRKTERVNKYQVYLSEQCHEMALDVHCFESYSNLNDLTNYGNKYRQTGNMQINLIGGYDTNTSTMVYSKFISGSIQDKTAADLTLEILKFKNTRFLIDNGFFSESVLNKMEENGNSFIIPLNRASKIYKKAVEDLVYDTEFIYTSSDKKTKIIWAKEIKSDVIPKGRRAVLYKDLDRNLKESGDYLSNVQKGLKGFSKEEYDQLKDFFGVFVLYTSEKETSIEEIFLAYKRRWKIETFFDTLKNQIDFTNFNIDDFYKIQGLATIILVASRIYSQMRNYQKKLKGYSMYELLTKIKALKIEKKKEKYVVENKKAEIKNIFDVMGIILPRELSEIPKLPSSEGEPT